MDDKSQAKVIPKVHVASRLNGDDAFIFVAHGTEQFQSCSWANKRTWQLWQRRCPFHERRPGTR